MKLRTTFLAGAFVLAAVTPVTAQTRSRPRTGVATGSSTASGTAAQPTRPKPGVRIGIAAPTPAPQPQTTVFGAPAPTTGLFTNIVVAPSTPRVVQVTYYPTVVLSNGQVLANFGMGRGYEQVLRQCPIISGALPPNIVIAPCFAVDSYGRYVVLQQR